MTETKTLAKQFFDLVLQESVLRQQVEDKLDEILGLDPLLESYPVEEYKFDWYDFSFELKGTASGLEFTPEMLPKFKEMGFHRAWICYKDHTEKAYSFLDVV